MLAAHRGASDCPDMGTDHASAAPTAAIAADDFPVRVIMLLPFMIA
jgi:hypothetical protein